MIPKDPVYPLIAAVERVKDIIPDQDAEDWLRDAIAADRITWAYIWMGNRDRSYPSLIDILPMAAIMEVPHLKIDWSKGTAAVRHPYGGVVECPVVISRRDLDRELANSTTLPEGDTPAPQPKPPDNQSIANETRCTKWLITLMNDTDGPEKTKTAYRTEAQDEFGVAAKAFNRAWGSAVAETGKTAWSKPGRKS